MRVEDDVGEGRVGTAERVRLGTGIGAFIGEGHRPLHHALPLSYPPAGPMASLPWLALPWHEVMIRGGGRGRRGQAWVFGQGWAHEWGPGIIGGSTAMFMCGCMCYVDGDAQYVYVLACTCDAC